MIRRQLTLRRTDLVACGAMLLSGLCAQVAMWTANHRVIYPIGATLLVLVSGLGAWQRIRQVRSGAAARFAVLAVKTIACVGIFAAALSTGALAALRHNDHRPSTTTAVGAILLLVQLVQSATVTSRRDLALGAPIVCAMLTQAGMAAHDSSPAMAFATSLAAMVVAIALIYRAELLDGANAVGGAGSAVLEAAAYPLLRVVVAAAVVFVLLPDSFHLAARPTATHSAAGTGNSAQADPNNPGDPGAHSRALVDPSTGRLDLRVRGVLSGVPIFVTSAAAPAYWQGAVYDHYDGSTWTMTGNSPGSDWKIASSTGVPVQQAPPDAGQPAGAQLTTRDDEVQIVSTQVQHVVFAPGRAVSYTGPGKVSIDVDGNPRLFGQPGGSPSSRDYDVSSTRPVVGAASSSVPVTVTTGDIADARWTQLPAELPARVRQLGVQLAASTTTRAGAVNAVDNYLRSNETYDLSAPLPAPGEDAVDDFLFVSHQGFCEQFATAAVMLLRSAGVPARLVTGYAEGDVSSDPGRRVMRGSDAHAWIQVWYPGTGWVDADPTASAIAATSTGSRTAPSAGAAAPSSGTSPKAAAPSTAESPGSSASPSPGAAAAGASREAAAGPLHRVVRAVSSLPGGRLVLAAAIVLLALLGRLLFVVGRRWARRRRRRSAEAMRPSRRRGGPILQAYLRLDDALVALGRPAAPGETPRELPARLAGLIDITPRAEVLGRAEVSGRTATLGRTGAGGVAGLTAAIALLERECFGAEPPSDLDVLSAVAVFNALSDDLRLIEATNRKVGASSAI